MCVETELAIRDAAAKVERVEIPNSDVASKENRMRSVQIHDLDDEIGDGVGFCAAEPAFATGHRVHGNMLCVVEPDVAVDIRVRGAVEGAEVEEDWRAVGSMGGEELVEEGCGAIEQDGLWSEEEGWVRGFGVLVAIELVLSDDGWTECVAVEDIRLDASVVGESGQLGEVGFIE